MSTTAVDAMRRAHRQIMQQARLEQRFSTKPKAWLDWAAVLTARARAVRAYELHREEGGPGARARLFDATLLTWLTAVPPDRVGVARKLQLGVTLKPAAGGGFELDLSTPNAHKTAAIFRPSTTAVPAAACALLQAWLAEAGLTTAAVHMPDGLMRLHKVNGVAGVDCKLGAELPALTVAAAAKLDRKDPEKILQQRVLQSGRLGTITQFSKQTGYRITFEDTGSGASHEDFGIVEMRKLVAAAKDA